MIFLYILISILLVLFLITLIPVGIKARYKNKVYCVLKIGFIKIRLLPEKPKKKKTKEKTKEKKSEKENQKETSFKKLLKQNGVSGIINILKRIASLAVGALKDIFKHIIIRELSLDVVIGGDDAAETALNYGKTCSVVYPAVSVITQSCICRDFNVLVSPDFTDGSESNATCKLEADIKIFWLVKAVIVHGFKALGVILKLQKANEPVNKDENLNNND